MTDITQRQPTYWQIGSGNDSRYYAKYCLRHGIAVVGGLNPCKTMKNEVVQGDIFLLRNGLYKIIAVGYVVSRNGIHKGEGNKLWLKDFDGWPLTAYCYVEWHQPAQPVTVSGMSRSPLVRVNKIDPIDAANDILSNYPPLKIEPDPVATSPVTDEMLCSYLIAEGWSTHDAEQFRFSLQPIVLLAEYYREKNLEIREHEIRTLLIIPLLLALGWSEKNLKIEYTASKGGRIDIACFSKPYENETSDKDCILLIESKNLKSGLCVAADQVKSYAISFPSCNTVITSNGFCYKAYEKVGDTFSDEPSAYMNITDFQDRYPLSPSDGAGTLEMIKLLLPK